MNDRLIVLSFLQMSTHNHSTGKTEATAYVKTSNIAKNKELLDIVTVLADANASTKNITQYVSDNLGKQRPLVFDVKVVSRGRICEHLTHRAAVASQVTLYPHNKCEIYSGELLVDPRLKTD
jgi:hypothetical protein